MENFYFDNIQLLNKNLQTVQKRRANLKVLQINIRSMNDPEKFDAIKEFLELYSGSVDVLVIGETWVKSNRIGLFQLDGY